MKGTVVTRTLKDGTKRYDAVWRANGKQKWRTFHRQKDADRFLTNAVKATHDGTYRDVRPLVVGDLFDRWLSESLDVRRKQGLLKPSTAKSYKSMLETHLRPAFGEFRSDRLGADAIKTWVAEKADAIEARTMAPKFYNNLLNLLHAILSWARHPAQSHISHDPLDGQQRLPRRRVERDFLERQEITSLLKAATTTVDEAILTVAVFTGLRRGELFALQWDDIDGLKGKGPGRLRIQRSVYQGAVTAPKTENSIRVVDVPRRVLEALERHKVDSPPIDGDNVFSTAEGTPIDPDNWYKRDFPAIRKRASLRGIGLHALRHTYASLLINQGENIKYVSRQLGHASIQITADLYGHLFKETSTAAMRRLDARVPLLMPARKVAVNRHKLRVVKGAA
jgi:integrase